MNKTSALSLILAVAALAVAFVSSQPQNAATEKKETVYERVMRTGTLRCGYVLWPHFIMKDPNTGAMSGAQIDYMHEVGKALDLKVEWTEEVGYGAFIEALMVDKIDMMCGIWPNPARAKQADFTRPIEYTAIAAFVRADDTRFDEGFAKLDDPTFAIATIDGEMAETIAKTDFPQARTLSLPQLSDNGVMLSNVADGKADIAFLDVTFGLGYMKNNPGKLKIARPNDPLRIGANALAVKKGQLDFVNMINVTTEDLISSGVIDRILNKYEPFPGSFYRIAKPYQTSLSR